MTVSPLFALAVSPSNPALVTLDVTAEKTQRWFDSHPSLMLHFSGRLVPPCHPSCRRRRALTDPHHPTTPPLPPPLPPFTAVGSTLNDDYVTATVDARSLQSALEKRAIRTFLPSWPRGSFAPTRPPPLPLEPGRACVPALLEAIEKPSCLLTPAIRCASLRQRSKHACVFLSHAHTHAHC